MSTAMDIVFCVGHTSSIASYFYQIRAMIRTIYTKILRIEDIVRIGLVKFRSSHDSWNTIVHGFTSDINVLQQWLDSDEPGGVSPDGCEAVGDALNEAVNFEWLANEPVNIEWPANEPVNIEWPANESVNIEWPANEPVNFECLRNEALNIEWPANNNNEIFNEKLVILITDGAPNGLFTPLIGADPWVISNRFIKEDITLVVVGVGESIIECDDFYCALAERTGGQYIPMVNFKRIFLNVINSVFTEGDTLLQALRHLSIEEIEENSSFKYSAMKGRVDGMINECETMNDIRKLFFKHRSYNI